MTPTDKQTVEAIGAGRDIDEAVTQLRFMAGNLSGRGSPDFEDFKILAHERDLVADNIKTILAALSPASPARTPMGGRVDGHGGVTWPAASADLASEEGLESIDALVDMARVGVNLMERLPEGYDYSDCPTEIVTDLQNKLDEAKTPMGGEVEALQEALRLTRERVRDWPLDDHETCMCGSPVEGHSIGSGHSPVSQADHAISMIVEGINEALAASSPSPAQGGEAALAISEHAFRAGHKAGWFDAKAGRIYSQEEEEESAWSEYEPPEEIKALS